MLAAGFIGEVERLHAMPEMNAACPAMRAVGYRQVWSWLEGEISREEAVRTAIVATRRLAKRQLTWLRREPGTLEFDCQQSDLAAHVVDALIPRLKAVVT